MDVEDYDNDFEGGFNAFGGNISVGTAQTSISSRLSVHSESIAGGDEDWNLVIDQNDESKAIQSAKLAGIPLPDNVPTSALLGGTIKRLGKKKSRQRLNDDWDNDIEMPDSSALQLKPRAIDPPLATPGEEYDEFEELEGSLGVRFAGTRRDGRARSSSVSAMSPSAGSLTAESEDDDLRGLELPEGLGPMDFEAILRKRRAAEAELSDLSQPSPALEQPATMNIHKKSKLLSDESEDFLKDFDLGTSDVLDSRKGTLNKNIKLRSTKVPTPSARPATTVNFHDKPVDKPMHTRSHIPRPVSGPKPSMSRLEPVFESGAPPSVHERRQPSNNTTTTGPQLLRSKRSMPVLRSHQQPTASSMQRGPAVFVPSGMSSNLPPSSQGQRAVPYHLRRDSDPHRGGPQSPPPRPSSRLSNSMVPDTPSRGARQRTDLAPAALVREAAAKRTMNKPIRRKHFGDGNELEIFDDLPTSTTKESKFVKQPVGYGPPRPGLRHTQSRSDIRDASNKRITAIPDRMMTPAPPRTPASPTKGFHDAPTNTPSYLRDTAASRIARETRLANNIRPRSEGPLMPLSTNWKAQVAARSPHASPSAQRQKTKGVQPQLIKGIGAHIAKTEKGMVYNPQTLRWEGNENTLQHFDLPPPLETPTPTGRREMSYMDSHQQHSPSRLALIAPMSAASAQGVQINGGMIFDPREMRWLKLKDGRNVSGALSSVMDIEEEDAFAGIEDLKDEFSPAPMGGVPSIASPISAAATGAGDIHEEFDLGPRFIETQQMEEATWRRRCAPWFVDGEPRADDGRWRWAIRSIAGLDRLQRP